MLKRYRVWLVGAAVGLTSVCQAQRINQEGRILGPLPIVTNSVLFNTPQADGILSAMQVLPVTSAWNEDISRLPLLPNSDAMIGQISADLASNRRSLRVFQEMNFVLVPDSQPPVPIDFVTYGDQSDPSPYPIPGNMPIESWPTGTGNLTLLQWQQNTSNISGDRHSIVVQPGAGWIWETWEAKLVGTNWQAANGAKFDLKSNNLRPAGWTSGDAAGLPMFPALPRYDEGERGMVEHACRIVVFRTRNEYLYPARHSTSTAPASQTNVPAMGQRLRLKSSFTIPSSWSIEEKAILQGLKKYGALVADNGNFFSISITPDDRWPANAFTHISTVGITNFEVVQGTGPTGGPRSPGAPVADAGPDMSASVGVPVRLRGLVSWTNLPPSILWKQYSGPAPVSFADASQTNTTATFSAPGSYVLMLSANDAVHSTAYDAVSLTVTQGLSLAVSSLGSNILLSWTGGTPPFVIEQLAPGSLTSWMPVLTNNSTNSLLPIGGKTGFFRLHSH